MQAAETLTNHIVHFVNKILSEAINQNASDIHFEPYEDFFRIRFRIDGMLVEHEKSSYKLANNVTTRLKILAKLDIAERRLPQDGRFQFKLNNSRFVDFRVSTCPTLFGEKVVLRVLESSKQMLDINSLGMNANQEATFKKIIERNQGLILVTGPTGSGKTSSLYSALNQLNVADKNISTVEDPIEIQIPGINQVQMNSKTGMQFTTAIRTFLRQDPDVIMIGEIRDFETADVCVKAAHTGHLVLSTLHTNSAAETLLRLMNMGVPSYNIASSISLIISQRLVRKLCEHCKEPTIIPRNALISAGFKESDIESLELYKPIGCKECHFGYHNRVGVFEVLEITDNLQQIILNSGSSQEITQTAIKEGFQNIQSSALEKVKQGITSLSEVNRVIASKK